MKVPEFQVAYREARLAAYSQAVAKLQQGATAAATTLLKGMLDQGTPSPPSIRTDKQSLCRWIAPAPVQFPPSPDAFHGSLGRVVCDAYIVGISAK